MNIIKTSPSEPDYVCAICQEVFNESDEISLIKHCNELTDQARHRRHLFHSACLGQQMKMVQTNESELTIDSDSNESESEEDLESSDNDDDTDDTDNEDEADHFCPLDRESISDLVSVKYSLCLDLNLDKYSHSYYELLNVCAKKHILELLLSKININYKDAEGKTLLYCACQRGNLKLVRKLVRSGADPCLGDDHNFTPLMACVTHGHVEIIKYLSQLNSIMTSLDAQDHKERTAMDYALETRKYESLWILVNIPCPKVDVYTPIYKRLQLQDPSGFNPWISKIKDKLKDRLGSNKVLNLFPIAPQIEPLDIQFATPNVSIKSKKQGLM